MGARKTRVGNSKDRKVGRVVSKESAEGGDKARNVGSRRSRGRRETARCAFISDSSRDLTRN